MQLTDLIYDLMVFSEQLEDKGITDTEVLVKCSFDKCPFEVSYISIDENNDVIINHV